ncbi:hypothetical protein [Luteolibacter sp. Populi]|uniref:hypothetical protein n=1 Tax=Luteolibacter sp. Populi TaxID=3230487 RepID=UPI003464F96D
MKHRICLAWFGDLDTPRRSRPSSGQLVSTESPQNPGDTRDLSQRSKERSTKTPPKR